MLTRYNAPRCGFRELSFGIHSIQCEVIIEYKITERRNMQKRTPKRSSCVISRRPRVCEKRGSLIVFHKKNMKTTAKMVANAKAVTSSTKVTVSETVSSIMHTAYIKDESVINEITERPHTDKVNFGFVLPWLKVGRDAKTDGSAHTVHFSVRSF
jgi:hypothetical protein